MVLSPSRMLVYSTMCRKIFSIYGVHIPRKCIESLHFYSYALVPHSKFQVEFFENLFCPRWKGWRKLWFALSKLVYLYFIGSVTFLNVMALQFCEYLSNSVVLSLLSLLYNYGNVTPKLHQEKLHSKLEVYQEWRMLVQFMYKPT